MKMLFKARIATFLENVCKVLMAAVCLLHVPAQAQFPSQIGDLDGDGVPTVLDLQRLLNHISGTNEFRLVPDVPGLTRQERDEFLDLTRDGLVTQADILALQDAILGRTTLPAFPATRLAEASPAHGEEMVSPDRTVIVRFSRRIQPATITSNAVYLVANNERLRGRLEVSSTAMFATFFPSNPLPASTEIRLVVDGNLIRDLYGLPVDTRSADSSSARGISAVLADGPSALRAQFDFRTLPLFRIPGTAVSGYVFDSYRTNVDGSPVPIIGATIRVDAFPEANAVTDERGYFTLTNVPAPQFFVHIDGSTAANAPPGFTYPSGGKLFHSVPGLSTVMPRSFAVYLPPMAIADAKPLRTDILTDVFFGPEGIAQLQRMFPTNDVAMFQKVCVRFPPRSAMDNAGRLATTGTIIPVPPDRIPSPLPPNLNPRLVISVQANLPDGSAATRLDVPAPVVFPNLDGLAPGEKALFFSFNHAAGRWDVIGAGTATTNGTIETDSGVGIRAPGWHLVQVGTQTPGEACKAGQVCARFAGRQGDVILIDLNGTVALSDPGFHNFELSSLSGGTRFDLPGKQLFNELGYTFFAPTITSASTGEGPTKRATPTPSSPSSYSGTFAATLIKQGSTEIFQPDPSTGCVPDGPGRVRCTGQLRVDVYPDYSIFGNPSPSPYDKINDDLTVYPTADTFAHILRIQQRLRYLGFPNLQGSDLPVTEVMDPNTRWAIGLFNGAVASANASVIGSESLNTSAFRFINSAAAPRWIHIDVAGSFSATASANLFGLDWTKDVLVAAASAHTFSSEYPITDISRRPGGVIISPSGEIIDENDAVHGTHQVGRNVDIGIVGLAEGFTAGFDAKFFQFIGNQGEKIPPGGTYGDVLARMQGNNIGVLWFRQQPNAATEYQGKLIGDTSLLAQGWQIMKAWQLVESKGTRKRGEPAYLRDVYSLDILVANQSYAIRRAELMAQFEAFLNANPPSGATVSRILFNDPYFFVEHNFGGRVIYWEHHNGHYHINVAAPVLSPFLAQNPLAPASPTPISTAPGFGSDTRLYYRFQLANGFELAGRSSLAGTFTEILSPNTDYTLTLYRASDNRWAVYRGRSNASGAVTDLGTLILDQFGGQDSDGDGIPDQGEYAIGTLPDTVDSDGDGLTDDAELTQGLNPNNRAAFPTGVIASLPLRGEAKEVVVEENLAYVATGSYGLAIVDVSRFDNPIVLGQLDLPGDATDVAVDTTLRLAVVACGSSVQIVDVSDPMRPFLSRVIPIGSSHLELLASIVLTAGGGTISAFDLRTLQLLSNLTVGGNLTDLVLNGDFIYTMDSGRRLRVIELTGFQMTARGSVVVPDGGGGRLFVANGIAYVPAFDTEADQVGGGGFSTVSVSNSAAPVIVSGVDRTDGRPGVDIVPTGSGNAVLVGTIFPTSFPQPRLYVMDVRDPQNTDAIQTFFRIPSGPTALRLASGIGFIASQGNGFVVANYQPFDSRRIPPSVVLKTTFPTNPLRSEEGQFARLTAITADDVQVRDVEFYVDGTLARKDVSFPFEYRFVTPTRSESKTSFTISAKATDTGGNSTWTDVMTVDLVDDATLPQVVRFYPAAGTAVSSNRIVAAYFSEPMEPATIDTNTFRLFASGPDGVLGTSDDIILVGGHLDYVESSMAAYMRFDDNLLPGAYRVLLSSSLSDRAANPLLHTFTNTFFVSQSLCTVLSADCVDTDGDGIPDNVEAGLGLNPLRADSDGNGIPDGAEDYDRDGLANAVEILRGTDPRLADPDRDGLNDYQELLIYQTLANNPDTDGDGWPDGLEALFRSSPRDANSRPPLRANIVSGAPTYFNLAKENLTTNLFLVSPIVTYENR